jgi:hypothetical protein
VTARWVVDEVAPARDLEVNWRSISLFVKNEAGTDTPYFQTHRLLRVFEAVKAAEGGSAALALYWEYGRRIHHDKNRDVTVEEFLSAVGLDASYAAAADEGETWDPVIESEMQAGLALTGNDVGTPIIAFDNAVGDRVAYFGPVITRVPSTELSLDLWDGLVKISSVPGFWELKRTRTERPDFGQRP